MRGAPQEITIPDEEAREIEATLIHTQEDKYDRDIRRCFDEEARLVTIEGDIEGETGDWFTQVHRYLCSLNEEPIKVNINTEGGDVQSMLMFVDVVRQSDVPIHITGHGNVCSAGVLMLASGHERAVTRHCVMMVHEFSHSEEEKRGLRHSEAKMRRKWEDWTHETMIDLMAEFSRKDVAYWKRIFEKKPEHWLLGGQDIVDEGLADYVVPYLEVKPK